MLNSTDDEIAHVKGYMASQAPDLQVTFVQKLHVENVLSHRHEVWDVHCDNDRGVSDYQAIGVRCRESTIAFVDVAQIVFPWSSAEPQPERADVKAWTDHICNGLLAGSSQAERRTLLKALLRSAWDFANWLTHAKSSTWHDSEAALTSAEHALGLHVSLVIRHIRKVPETCPACRSHRLSPERGVHSGLPDGIWERPVCDKCGWTGEPVLVSPEPIPPSDDDQRPPEGECIVPNVPLAILKRPN